MCLKILFSVYLFLKERETEREWGRGRGRETERETEPKQALSSQHRARCGARSHEPWDHDLSPKSRVGYSTSWATQVPQMEHILFVHSARSCFRFMLIIDKPSVNICVQVICVNTCLCFSWVKDRGDVASSHGGWMFKLLRNCRTIFQSDWLHHSTFQPEMYEWSQFLFASICFCHLSLF